MGGRLLRDEDPTRHEPATPYPLSHRETDEHETDLIAFCDAELDRLGEITGLSVLYAGGASPLWLEGLSQRIEENGTLTALELDPERLRAGRDGLRAAELAAPVDFVPGSVFAPPFEDGSFDLVYSSGLFHELDVRGRSADDALAAMVRVTRPGGRVAAGDFVDSSESIQIEDERLDAEQARLERGVEPFGIGPPEGLVGLFERHLRDVGWDVAPPFPIRHLDRLVLAGQAGGVEGREELRRRILREGYTRPSTLYVEGKRGGA